MLSSLFRKTSGNIPGIYNYCDAWCERCRFNTRCGNYKFRQKLEAMIKEDLGDEDTEITVQTSVHVIQGKEGDHSVEEPNYEEPDPEFQNEFERKHKRITAHELSKVSDTYFNEIGLIFNENKSPSKLAGISMDKELAEMLDDIPSSELSNIIFKEHEAILRFSMAIHVKLHRALGDWFDILDGDGDSEFNEMDMNGTAKLVLVMTDEMIHEWHRLKNEYPRFTQQAGYFTEMLINIRELTENQFPKARAHVRKGHDE